MNWKPKKGKGKTLYVVDTWGYNFKSESPYDAWINEAYAPPITKFKNVLIITNGVTKSGVYIVAKRNKDKELKTYKLKKIDTIEEKQNAVIMKGQNIFISNDKKELLKIFTKLYKTKEQASRNALEKYKNVLNNYSQTDWMRERLIQQPKNVMKSYKFFLEQLKLT